MPIHKYYRVYTIADGYHDGNMTELTREEYCDQIDEAGKKYTFVRTSSYITFTSSWLQYQIKDEDGVAFVWKEVDT